jgi:2'-5' RNA ligase
MKRIVIAYWLLPAGPERSFFQQLINDLAQRYCAPVFEPHLTIHVGTNCADMAEKALVNASYHCKPVTLKTLQIGHSSEFIKTLFVEFPMTAQLRQLIQTICVATEDPCDYQLNPHLSLLYKKISNHERPQLTRSIEVPFAEVKFDSLKAIQCISPTESHADVEAWCAVAEKSLGSLGT